MSISVAPFTYFGGKARLADDIIALFPPHRVYIEPFFGSGAVFFAKRPATHEIINDVDDAIVAFFRVLRDNPEGLEAACRLSPYARAEYDACKTIGEGLDDLEKARRLYVRISQSFGKTGGSNTGWSRTVARTQSLPASMLGRIGRFATAAVRLADATIEHTDACDLIEAMATDDTVVYADPPYLAATRSMRSGNANDYRHDAGGAAFHERLAATLHATPATVFLSGYPSDLYDRLYDGWDHVDFDVKCTSSDGRRGERARRVERVWSNRPIRSDPQLGLFDHTAGPIQGEPGVQFGGRL